MARFTDQQIAFLQSQRVGRLATADLAGRPHVVPRWWSTATATTGGSWPTC